MDFAFALPMPIPAWVSRLAAVFGLVFTSAVPVASGEIDRLVVARARKGDHLAFAQVVDHYDRRLRRLAYRLLEDRDRMDDVLQEAYVKAFRSLPRFRGDAVLGTWLYRIVYNACIDDLRSHKAVSSLDDFVDAADTRPGPDDVAVARGDLISALSALPPDQRAAVLLVDAEGLDYSEAAKALGVAAGTIGSRLARARAGLRLALGSDRTRDEQ